MINRCFIRILPAVIPMTLAYCVSSAAQDAGSRFPFPHITINGTASDEVQPDLAEIRFGVVTKDSTAAGAAAENAKLASASLEVVRKLSVDDKDIRTISTSLNAVFVEDKDPKTLVVISRRPDGYQAVNLIAVRIRDIKRVGEISSALIDHGVNRFDGVSFEVSDRAKRMDAIREDAILDAKRKADIYAHAVATKLGEVFEIVTESTEPVGEADLPARRQTPGPMSISVPIAAGTTELSVTVEVTWKLAPQ